jgi:hypothetical protein
MMAVVVLSTHIVLLCRWEYVDGWELLLSAPLLISKGMSLSRLRLVMLIMTSTIAPLNYCVHDLLFVITPIDSLFVCCSRSVYILFALCFAGAL